MVTYDLRNACYVDKVIQMKDDKVSRIIEDRAEIDALAERSANRLVAGVETW